MSKVNGVLFSICLLMVFNLFCVARCDVFAAYYATCALFANSQVKCWGRDFYYGSGTFSQIGDEPGEMGSTLQFIDFGTNFSVVEIAFSYAHACALSSKGQVKCIGENVYGALGFEYYIQNPADPSDIGIEFGARGDDLPFIDLANDTVIQIVVGDKHTCVLLDYLKVKCFGHGPLLATGTTYDTYYEEMGTLLAYADLGTNYSVVKLSAGFEHTCAIFDNRKVKCWGVNYAGQLGYGDFIDRGAVAALLGDNLPFLQFPEDLDVTEVACGYSHSCALFSNGRVRCWGDNHYGQLGYGDGDHYDGFHDFIDFGINEKVVQISAGQNHNCAVMANGEVKCWGDNSLAQLGDSRVDEWSESYMMIHSEPFSYTTGNNWTSVDLGVNERAIKASCGEEHTCVLLQSGHIKCWGYGGSGAMGYENSEFAGYDEDYGMQMGDALPYVQLGNVSLQLPETQLQTQLKQLLSEC